MRSDVRRVSARAFWGIGVVGLHSSPGDLRNSGCFGVRKNWGDNWEFGVEEGALGEGLKDEKLRVSLGGQ